MDARTEERILLERVEDGNLPPQLSFEEAEILVKKGRCRFVLFRKGDCRSKGIILIKARSDCYYARADSRYDLFSRFF